MFEYITTLDEGFLKNPQKLISKLVHVRGFSVAAREIMYAGIEANFKNKKNPDGSSWAPNTPATLELKKGDPPDFPGKARMKPIEFSAHTAVMMATGNYYKQTTQKNANALHRMIMLRTEGAETAGVEKKFSVVTIGASGKNSRSVINETKYRISPRSFFRKTVNVSQRAVLWIDGKHADMIRDALVNMLDRNLRRL